MLNEDLYNCQSNKIYPTLGDFINKDNSEGNEFTMTELLNIIKRNDPNELYKLKFINYFVNGRPIDGDEIKVYNDNDEMVQILGYLHRIDKISHDIFKVYCGLLELCDPQVISIEYIYRMMGYAYMKFRHEFHSNYTLNFYRHLRRSLAKDMKFLSNIPPTLVREFSQILLNCKESGIMPVEALMKFDLSFIKMLGISITEFDVSDLDILTKVKDCIGIDLVKENINIILNLSKKKYNYKIISKSIKEVSEDLNNSHFINNLNV